MHLKNVNFNFNEKPALNKLISSLFEIIQSGNSFTFSHSLEHENTRIPFGLCFAS